MNAWFYKTIDADGNISHETGWDSGELPENAVVWDKSFLNQFIDRINARIGACNIANALSHTLLTRISEGNAFVGYDTGDSFIDYCWDALKSLRGAWNGGTISSGTTLFDSDDIIQVKYLSSIYSYLTEDEDKDIKNGSGIYDTAGELVFDDSTRSRFRSLREIIDLVDTFCCDAGAGVFYGSTSDAVYGTGSAEWVYQWDPSGTDYESDSASCPVASQLDHPISGDGSAWPWVWPYMAGRFSELYYGTVSCARISNGSIHLPAPGISVNVTLTPYGRGVRIYEGKAYDNMYYATENALYSMSAITDTFGVSDRPSVDITSPFGTLDLSVGSGGSGYRNWAGVVAVLIKINDDDTPQP